MGNVYTIGDFLTECRAYPYSKENYEIMKEAYEISLMEKWLSSQKYMKEHEELKQYDGMFLESSTDDHLDLITESIKDRAVALVKKIAGGFRKLIEMIIKAFRKIGEKLRGQDKEVKALLAKTITKEQADEIVKRVEAWINSDSNLKVLHIASKSMNNVKFDSKVKIHEEGQKIQHYFYTAFSPEIEVRSYIDNENNFGGNPALPLLSAEEVAKLLTSASNVFKTGDLNAFDEEYRKMTNITDETTKTFTIYAADDSAIKKVMEDLNAIKDFPEMNDSIDDKALDFNNALIRVKSQAARTLAAYVSIINLRINIQQVLGEVLNEEEIANA